MKKQLINEQFNRMQKIAGLITENQINEESHSPDKMFELMQMYISNYRDGGMGAGAALNKIEDILDGKLDGYDIAFLKGEEDLYENKTQLNEDEATEIQAEKIKALIYQDYREIVDSGQVEKGTEEWLFLLQLALKVYGLDIQNEYDILKGIDGKGPYAKQIKALGYSWIQALEIALSDLEVESY